MDDSLDQIRQTLHSSDPLLLRCGDRTAISACPLFQEFQACRHDAIMFGLQFLQRFRTHPHLGLLMVFETSSRRDEVPQDNVLFQADQVIDLSCDRRLSQNLGRLLETGGRDEAFALNGGLGDPQKLDGGC